MDPSNSQYGVTKPAPGEGTRRRPLNRVVLKAGCPHLALRSAIIRITRWSGGVRGEAPADSRRSTEQCGVPPFGLGRGAALEQIDKGEQSPSGVTDRMVKGLPIIAIFAVVIRDHRIEVMGQLQF